MLVVLLALILSGVDRHILSLLIHPIERSLDITDTQISLLHGLAFVGLHAVATLLIAAVADRGNRPAILFLGIVVWSAMCGFSGLAGSFAMLALCRGGIGIGEASVIPAGYSLVGDHYPPERRGAVTGLLSAATVAGAGLALVIGGAILSLIGDRVRIVPLFGALEPWRLTFILLGIGGLPVALLALTLRDRRAPAVVPAEREPASTLASHVFAHKRAFASVLGAGACNALVGIGTAVWAPTVLVRRFDLAASEAGYLIGLAVILGGVAGATVGSAMSDRWLAQGLHGLRLHGHPKIIAFAAGGVALFTLGATPLLSAIGYAILSFGINALSAISYAAMQDLSPSGLRARALAMMHFVAALLGYALGPTLVALVTDYLYRDPQALSLSVLTVAIPLYAAAALIAKRGFTAYMATHRALNPGAMRGN